MSRRDQIKLSEAELRELLRERGELRAQLLVAVPDARIVRSVELP